MIKIFMLVISLSSGVYHPTGSDGSWAWVKTKPPHVSFYFVRDEAIKARDSKQTENTSARLFEIGVNMEYWFPNSHEWHKHNLCYKSTKGKQRICAEDDDHSRVTVKELITVPAQVYEVKESTVVVTE